MRQRRKAPPNCGRTLWVRDSRPFRSLRADLPADGPRGSSFRSGSDIRRIGSSGPRRSPGSPGLSGSSGSRRSPGIARIADERPALVGIGRKSRRNEEGLAGMQKVSPGCINRQLTRCACRARQPSECLNRRAAGSKDRRKGRRGTARPI